MMVDGEDNIRRLFVDAPEKTVADTWPDPDLDLIEEDQVSAPVLKDNALPDGWAGWIGDQAAATACPPDYLALDLLVAASQWIGNARHVAATADWREPPHLWGADIGPPSFGKSPALRPILKETRQLEIDAEPAWKEACVEHASLAEGARAIEETWKKEVRDAVGRSEAPPDRPIGADPPDPPPMPRYLAMDVTTEELQMMLSKQQRGLLFVRDELSGWFGNHDRYGGHGGDRAFYIEAWDGGPYVVDRVKHGGTPIRIARASVAILGGLQPDALREVMIGPNDGLISRFLFVWPAPVNPAPLSPGDATATAIRREQLIGAARRLSGLVMDGNPSAAPAPRLIELDGAAFHLFNDIRLEAIRRSRSSRGLAAGWHGKTPGRMLRVALVYELLSWAVGSRTAPSHISVSTMTRAAAYLDYAGAMFERVTAGLSVTCEEEDAAVLARHLLEAPPDNLRINERALYQGPGLSWLRDKERRTEAIDLLADAAWLRKPPKRGSGRPRSDWEINPKLYGDHR
jgi:hypothetical protein